MCTKYYIITYKLINTINNIKMCGIWSYFSRKDFNNEVDFYKMFLKLRNRGPDRSKFEYINFMKIHLYLGFHRLSIMDPSVLGDQPFCHRVSQHKTVYTICNGEIYNYKQLIKKYNLKPLSSSDCEVIPLLYMSQGFETVISELCGEYACVLIELDHNTKTVSIKSFTDHTSVRPLFYAKNNDAFSFSSELKGLVSLFKGNEIKRFPPGSYMDLVITKNSMSYSIESYYNFVYDSINITNLDIAKQRVRETLVTCVRERLFANRELGCLLSGGLDSSLVASIASMELKKLGKTLKTFSIGMPGATDEKYAKMVAKHIGSEHTHYTLSNTDFLDALNNVIEATETFDITTIRASTGQYLISKLISEKTNIKVLLIGDGSDELCSGYMYFHNAPTPKDSHDENRRLLKDIHLYDVLRADRGIAFNGLEARVPFLDYRFIDLYMSIDPKLRIPTNGIEKWLLRSSFEGNYLPHEVLWRKKEAFSDGVSSTEKSWFEIIQELANEKYTDATFKNYKKSFEHCPPPNKEALYFRLKFEELFGSDDVCKIIPYYWLPKWCGNITEPSARVLGAYNQS